MAKTAKKPTAVLGNQWPADRVDRWKLDDLMPSVRNPRKHSSEHVDQIAKSIERYGFTMPILVDEDGEIIAGHGRVLAAKKLGITEVPVMVATGWSDQKKAAYRIADNRLTEIGEWDDDILRSEIESLADDATHLDVIGFTDAQIKSLMAAGGKKKDDKRALNVEPVFQILIDCEGEQDQRAKLETLQTLGIKCKALIA